MTDVLEKIKEQGLKKILPGKPRIAVGMDTCGIGNGAQETFRAFEKILRSRKINAYLTKTGCFGFCSKEPLVNVSLPGKPLIIFKQIKPENVAEIIDYIVTGKIPSRHVLCKIESWDHLTGTINYGLAYPEISSWNEVDFFKWQKKIVLRNSGLINPEDIEEYLAVGGYNALFKTLKEFSPAQVVEEIKKSKLRGRGGAGYPTGRKWELLEQTQAEQKFIICNADEGDPGAYMNRNEIESDPHSLIEGMVIGAYAMGAHQGVIYVRAEYPLAVERLKIALAQAKKLGIFGKNIFGTSFNFNIEIVEGAGAFVCGEETALMASIEGQAGRPRPRPPFPAEKGLYGKPTTIDNVETWFNVPVVMSKGATWFAQTGTDKSPGTKVFSLVGKIKNTGLVELPLGTALQTLVYNIGEGTGTNKRVKAVQSGGPSGGCIPAELFNTPVDYESLTALGTIMGSGGMVVMDDDNCMVDVARYFTEFTTAESCGKCTPCREGLFQSLTVIKNITEGKASEQDLETLETLGSVIKDSALCGLGQTGPNPVLTTMQYFKNEYLQHIKEHHCDAGVCGALFISPCENSCPLHMNIPGFLELTKEERLLDTFEIILRDNPLPASTGRICHFHCKMRCRREDIDDPVSQGEVHRYVADTVYKGKKEHFVIQKLIAEKFPRTGKKIAIIGAGPAGLMAAFYLVRLGHDVTIYEAQAEAGGVLRYGIPQYRLPREVLAKEIGFIKTLGVKFVFNKAIGTPQLKKLKKETDAIFLATGAYKNMPLGIPGEKSAGVFSGVEYLKDIAAGKKPKIGKDVLIVGAGNVAIDAARSAWRLGSKVTVVYRREKKDMPANKEEILEAEHEGIKFMFFAAPKEVLTDSKGKVRALKVTKMAAGDYDFSGRKKPLATSETHDIACDAIIVAIGEKVDSVFLEEFGIEINKNTTVKADSVSLATNVKGVYAGGDLTAGPGTAVEAMADGKKAAQAIDRELMKKDRFLALAKTNIEYDDHVPAEVVHERKQSGKKLGLPERKNNFREVSLGLTKTQVTAESLRCLRCDVKE